MAVDFPWSRIEEKQDPVIVLGGGPSLKGFDTERLKPFFTIALNFSAIYGAPWAHVWHTQDVGPAALDYQMREMDRVGFQGRRIVAAPTDPDTQKINRRRPDPVEGVEYLKRDFDGRGLSNDPEWVIGGYNSSYSALNIAHLMGAKNIFLFGIDLDPHASYAHWHDYPDNEIVNNRGSRAAGRHSFHKSLQRYKTITRGGIYNCSPASWIEPFPKMAPEEGLELLCSL